MPDELSGVLRLPFPEQIAALRIRFQDLRPTAQWDDLKGAEHDKAFMVAGAVKADLLADLAAAVDKAVSEGTSLETFRRDFRAIVAQHGWHGWTGEGTAKGEAWRTRVIYRTNIATTYAAGRLAQLREAAFPFWVYRHSGAEHPRLDHLSWDGLTLPADHPFWATHYPPNGWGCGCRVAGARSERGARRLGGDPSKVLPPGWDSISPKTGAPPGIGKGWDHAPGDTVSDTISVLKDKMERLPAPIGSALAAALPTAAKRSIDAEFRAFVDEALSGPPRGKHIVIGALAPKWVAQAEKHGVLPETAEIAVRDADIWHTFRDAKKGSIDLDWYRDLPSHLRSPRLVLLDRAHDGRPALLLVYDAADGLTKIVVQVNYRLKKAGVLNVATTGRLTNVADLKALIGKSAVIIDGNL